MKLLVGRTISTVLHDSTIEKVLGIYPEEELAKREVFADAFKDGEIRYQDLRAQSNSIGIPWQFFFLSAEKIDAELAALERLRHKVSKRLLAKRPGSGEVTSRRILDRLLRLQTYLSDTADRTKTNPFCGSLKGRYKRDAVAHIWSHFAINRDLLRRKNKVAALEYLIERFEAGGINVCQGVLTNGMLPHLKGSRTVYKNTSGFVIRDECVPFAFIPSEINPDEKEGRQILTLVFLVSLIGLDAYDHSIGKDFKVSMLAARGQQRAAYDITTEFLLPEANTEVLRGTNVTASMRDDLATRHKITPTAVVVILRKRGIISAAKYEELTPPPQTARAGSVARTPKIEKSVRKFNGKFAYEQINRDFSGGQLTPVQTQYLLFGAVKKKAFRDYKRNLSL